MYGSKIGEKMLKNIWSNISFLLKKGQFFLLLFFAILWMLLYACSGVHHIRGYSEGNISDYYINSGVGQYLLPPLPLWANFSVSGHCRKSHITYYVDLQKLRSSFNYSYADAVQFNYLYNKLRYELERNSENTETSGPNANQSSAYSSKTSKSNKKLASSSHHHRAEENVSVVSSSVKEEEIVFYNTKDSISAGTVGMPFKAPVYKVVNLIWIDPAFNSPTQMQKLNKLMSSDMVKEGQPVFVSLCMFGDEIERFISNSSVFKDIDIRVIPQEMFTVFPRRGSMLTNFQLFFDDFFKEDQKLNFFIPEKNLVPIEFKGRFKVRYY